LNLLKITQSYTSIINGISNEKSSIVRYFLGAVMQVGHVMKLNTIKLSTLGLILMSCLSSLAIADETLSADPNKAKTIVTTVCAACHGADGNSAITLNPKLAGQLPEYIEKQLTEFKSGKRENAVMKGMADMLSAQDIKNVAAYFASQKPAEASARSNGKGSLGEKIYRAGIAKTNVPACAACHGPNGAGLPVKFPKLSGQHSDYTTAQLKAFRTSTRKNGAMMTAIAEKLTDAQMAAVADYIQGLR
jgi:cbb3-type cytochrome c oxidase subunit III